MKIGALAKQCGVSVATIRYYVSLGILAPDDSNAQYEFSDREVEDLKQILRMRKQSFKLKEIQDYMVLMHHSKMIEPATIHAALQILEDKQSEIREKIEQLQESSRELDEEMKRLKEHKTGIRRRTGVPVMTLPLLACPVCGAPLRIEDAVIEGSEIISGSLVCQGSEISRHQYHAVIDNGIIKTGNLYSGMYDRPDLERGLYRNMGPDFSLRLQKCYDRITGLMVEKELHNKVILEANINGYFYMYNHLNLLPEDCTLIVVDKYSEMLEMYKELIEQLDIKCRILYIADAAMDYPLSPECVDLHISYFGENEHMLYHEQNYLSDARKYLKKEAKIYGAYLSYDKQSASRKQIRKKYPESGERCYQIEYLTEDYRNNGFELKSQEMGAISDSGTRKYCFECHVPGEILRIYSFTALRKL